MVQSDHQEYFQEMMLAIGTHPAFTEVPWEQADVGPGCDWEGTNFEIKYAREGRGVYRAAFVAS